MIKGDRLENTCAIALIIVSMLITGCSHGSHPIATEPDNELRQQTAIEIPSFGHPGHQCWGFWQLAVNRGDKTVELIPAREGTHHLNALAFLEPPALNFVDLDWPTLNFDPDNNYVEVVVIIRHPFPGLDEFTGFDVRGILVTDGEQRLWDSSEVFASYGEPRLANADGLTRWWNPSEFLGDAPYGYTEGLIGTPGGASVFSATLNGYKYFCKGLGPYDEMTGMNLEDRGHFPAGEVLKRNYMINFGDDPADFLVFNYAVDASWEFPGAYPPDVPGDFPSNANCREPFWIEAEVLDNTLFYVESSQKAGGRLEMKIAVHDWQGVGTIGEVLIDNPAVLEQPIPCAPLPVTDPNKWEFYVKTKATGNLSSTNPVDIIIKALSYDGSYKQGALVPFFGPADAKLRAYHRVTVDVSPIPIPDIVLESNCLLPPPFPYTVTKDFSIIGDPDKEGVYYFGSEDFTMYRYPLDYSEEGELYDTFEGFLSFSPSQLWTFPSRLAKFDMTQAGEFVMYSESTMMAFLPPYLVRDFAFQFNNENDPYGRSPVQGISPGPLTGIMKVVDISATVNFDDTDVVFWIHVDDEAEPSEPKEGITVPLLYYRYPYTSNIFEGDIGAISGSPIPAGPGPGKVEPQYLRAFSVTGIPFTAEPFEYDITCAFLESMVNEIEIFGISCNDSSDQSNQHLKTITAFKGSPMDIEIFPAVAGGFDESYDWLAIIELGLDNETVLEVFSLNGDKIATSDTFTGTPLAVDVDPYNYKIHIWYQDKLQVEEPISAAVFGVEL